MNWGSGSGPTSPDLLQKISEWRFPVRRSLAGDPHRNPEPPHQPSAVTARKQPSGAEPGRAERNPRRPRRRRLPGARRPKSRPSRFQHSSAGILGPRDPELTTRRPAEFRSRRHRAVTVTAPRRRGSLGQRSSQIPAGGGARRPDPAMEPTRACSLDSARHLPLRLRPCGLE